MEKRRREDGPGVFPGTPAGEPARGRGIEPGTPSEEVAEPQGPPLGPDRSHDREASA